MKRTIWMMVLTVVILGVFAAPAMAAEFGSWKFYDTNMDGVKQDDEPRIPGWKVDLYKADETGAYALSDSTLTLGGDFYGWYYFFNLPVGSYIVREAVGGGCWVQTKPVNPDYYAFEITDPSQAFYCETQFGNVCKRCVKGYTMGFWSNKNGLRLLKAYAGLDGVIENIPKYGPMSVAEIQAMAKEANAVDMCVMLKAQYVAHWLSVNLKDADYSGAGIIVDGELVDYDDAIAEFAGFTCALDGSNRAEAEDWKDFFDGLNNNWFPVVEYPENMCEIPAWD
jgi:hypothetical protein